MKLRLFVAIALAALGLNCTAQVIDEPLRVMVKLKLISSGSITMTGDLPLPSGITPPLTKAQTADFVSTAVEIGKNYTVTLTGATSSSLTMIQPPGYTLLMGKTTEAPLARASVTITSSPTTFNVRLMAKAENLDLPVGECTSLRGSGIHWQASLGKLRNGNPAGAISLIGSGIGQEAEPWTGFFNASALTYVSDSSGVTGDKEVYVLKSPAGAIAQIRTNEAYVNVTAATAADSFTGFWIKFYRRDQFLASAVYPAEQFSGDPFTTYKVERLGATKLKITKYTRNHQNPTDKNVSVSRTEWTTIERTIPDAAQPYNFKWKVLDWSESLTETDAGIRVREVAWSNSDALGNRTEVHTTRYNGSSKVDARLKRQVEFNEKVGERFTNIELGAADSSNLSTNITYFNSEATAAARDVYGLVDKTTTNGGLVTSYVYFDSSYTAVDSIIGQLRQSFTTYLDGVSATDPNVGERVRSTYSHSAGPPGFPRRLAGIGRSMVRTNLSNGQELETRLISDLDIDYTESTSSSRPAVVRARRSDGTLDSIIKYYREDVTDALYRNQLYSIERPNESKTSISYEHGKYNESTFEFVPGSTAADDATRIRITRGYSIQASGTVLIGAETSLTDAVYVKPFKSTRTDICKDGFARISRVTESALSATAPSLVWDPIGAESYQYTLAGALKRKLDSSGGEYTANYVGHRLVDETLPSGEVYSYQYDVNGRVWKIVKAGSAGDPRALVTEFVYDSADRVVGEKTYNAEAAVVGREELVSTWSFDEAGRILSASVPGSDAVSYAYEPASNRFRATYPIHSGLTEAPYVYVCSYKDGRHKATWGTATTKRVTEYGFNPLKENWEGHPEYGTYSDGKSITETIDVGGGMDDSIPVKSARSRWVRLTRDQMGRPVEELRPGPHTPVGKDLVSANANEGVSADQVAILKTYTYDEQYVYKGLLRKISQTGAGDRLFKYNDINELIEAGVDVSSSGSTPYLSPGSMDRILGIEDTLVKIENQWWSQTSRYIFGVENSDQKNILSVLRTRLSGYSASNPVKRESVQIDADGNTTTTKLEVARDTKQATLSVSTKGVKAQTALNDSVTTFENGIPRTRTGTDLNWEKLAYDDLYRLKETSSNRITTGISQISYKRGTELVETVKTRANNLIEAPSAVTWATVVTNTYNDAGLLNSTTDSKGAVSYFKYNARGQLIETWGSARYPEKIDYNAFGEPERFYTFRGSGFDGVSFPGTSSWGDYSVTEFVYTPSGFLESKKDNNAKGAVFSYYLDGKIKTREWERLVGTGAEAANKVKTTYTYSAATRELMGVAYNDGTPGLTLGYSRTGSINQVSDVTGTRSFGFYALSPWRLDAEYLPAFFNDRVLTRRYESPAEGGSGKLYGRSVGFTLGTVGDPGKLLGNYNEMGAQGRIDSIITGSPVSGLGQRFNYGYHANASLISSITAKGNSSGPNVATTPFDFVTTKTYENNRDFLERISTRWGDQTTGLVSEFTYKINLLGQNESVQDAGKMFTAAYGPANSFYRRFNYNLRGELDSAKTYGGTVPASAALDINPFSGRQFGFTYDSAGNRTKSARGTVLNDDSYTINGLNQISGRDNKAVSVSGVVDNAAIAVANQAPARINNYWQSEFAHPGTAAEARQIDIIANRDNGAGANLDSAYIDRRYIYFRPKAEVREHDLDGNLIADGMWTYKWDAENRLRSMTQRPWVGTLYGELRKRLEFKYDYMGRRVSKVVKTTTSALESDLTVEADWTPVSERRFVYDGWNLVAEFDPSLSTATSPEGDLIRSYAWGLSDDGVLSTASEGGALLQITDHVTKMSYFPSYDGNGNVVSLTRAADGALVAEYEYGPFGEPLRQTGICAKVNPFRFGTKYTDDESGLVYYGMRYYEPRNGRFINRDPIGEAGGSNLYGFVGNDPINSQDLLGMEIFIGGGGSYDGSDLTPGDVGGSTSGGISVSVGVGTPDWYYSGSPSSGGNSGGGSKPKPKPKPLKGVNVDSNAGVHLDSIKNATGYNPMEMAGGSIGITYGVEPSSSLLYAQDWAIRMGAPIPFSDEEMLITDAYRGMMINREQMFDAAFLGVDVATLLPSFGISKVGTSLVRSGLRRSFLAIAEEVAPRSIRGFGAVGLDKLPTGASSAVLRDLYIKEAESLMFRAKLGTYNLLTGSRVTSAQVVEQLVMNSEFRLTSRAFQIKL